nr:unnamed protein product [Callosobruchus analis]
MSIGLLLLKTLKLSICFKNLLKSLAIKLKNAFHINPVCGKWIHVWLQKRLLTNLDLNTGKLLITPKKLAYDSYINSSNNKQPAMWNIIKSNIPSNNINKTHMLNAGDFNSHFSGNPVPWRYMPIRHISPSF